MPISTFMCSQERHHLQPGDTHFIPPSDGIGWEEPLGYAQDSEFWSTVWEDMFTYLSDIVLAWALMWGSLVWAFSILQVQNPQSSDIYNFLCAGIMPGMDNLT